MTKNTHYELTFIVDGNIPETEHANITKNVKDLLLKHNASIISEIELGRKKLNYPIKKSLKGNYFSFEFNILPSEIKPIENGLKLENNVLRFLMIKKPANIINKPSDKDKLETRDISSDKDDNRRSDKKVKKDFKQEQKAPEIKKEIKEEVKPVVGKEIKEEKEEIKEEIKEEVKPEVEIEKVEKDELDQKLDEILNKEEF